MQDSFTFSLPYNKTQREFEASFERRGYSYRINVTIDGALVSFEPDEERNFRAVIPVDYPDKQNIDVKMVAAIAGKLEELFR